MKTAEIYKLQTAINLMKARKPQDIIRLSEAFDEDLASLLEQGEITEEQLKEINFPTWDEMEKSGERLRKALLTA
jgi:hypothetical protein